MKPTKSVSFNPKVEVHTMDISIEEHAKEIKRPKDFMAIVPYIESVSGSGPDSNFSTNNMLAIFIIMFIIIIASVIIMSRWRKNNNSAQRKNA
jgi:hypothetical protein